MDSYRKKFTIMHRFVASSSPALDKVNTWSIDWQQRIIQKLDRSYQQSEYDIKSLREQMKSMD